MSLYELSVFRPCFEPMCSLFYKVAFDVAPSVWEKLVLDARGEITKLLFLGLGPERRARVATCPFVVLYSTYLGSVLKYYPFGLL